MKTLLRHKKLFSRMMKIMPFVSMLFLTLRLIWKDMPPVTVVDARGVYRLAEDVFPLIFIGFIIILFAVMTVDLIIFFGDKKAGKENSNAVDICSGDKTDE